MRKPHIVFVGAFPPAGSKNVIGGQVFACRALLSSPLGKAVNWTLIDTTMESIPPPPLHRRALNAGSRLVRFCSALALKSVDEALVFAAVGLSFYEKGLMIIMAKLAGKRTVFCPRGGPLLTEYDESALTRVLLPMVLRRSDVTVCQGRRWKEFFQRVSGLPSDRFVVIGNTLAADKYDVPRQDGRSDAIVVTILGWVIRDKGVFDLVTVAAKTRNAPFPFRFVVAGDGPDLPRLRQAVNDEGVADRFEFLGWVDEVQKLGVLARTDIFTMLSYSEGFPNALLEAMATGAAVIATDIGAVNDLVEPGVTGLLCAPGDVEAIAGHLLDLAASPEGRRQLGTAAQQRVRLEFNSERIWERWWSVLHANPGGPPPR